MSFEALKFTTAGKALQIRALSGEPLVFTQIQVGEGTLTAESIPTLTGLVSVIKSINISKSTRTDERYTIEGAFRNDEIARSFYYRELGIFAADPEYPDERSKDILYAYQNAYDTAEYISISSGEIIEKLIRVNLFVGEADTVSAVIDSSTVFVTRDEMSAGLEGKADSEHTHTTADIENFPATLPDDVARAAVTAHAGNAEIHVTAAEKAAWSAVSGANLLDNSDFAVNQRGQAEYAAAGYTVDRWYINIGKVEPAANGIVITNNGTGIMRLRQNTEFGYAQIAGKPLSVSVRAGGTTYSATANVPAEKPTAAFTELAGVEIADGVSFVCNYSSADDMIFAYFGLAEGASVAPEWVKLEVGAATPYVPPHPADALARCQRYYQIRSTNDIDPLDLRPSMGNITDIKAVEGGYAYVAEL